MTNSLKILSTRKRKSHEVKLTKLVLGLIVVRCNLPLRVHDLSCQDGNFTRFPMIGLCFWRDFSG